MNALPTSPIAKPIAQILASLVTWATAITVSPESQITAGEWVVLLGFCVAGFLVWLVPNTPYINPARDSHGHFAAKEAGQTNIWFAVVISVVVVLLILIITGVLPAD